MYYKQKYIKYKLKYLNLVGGVPEAPQTLNLGDYTIFKLYENNCIIQNLLEKPYSVKNYLTIKNLYEENTLKGRDKLMTKNFGLNNTIIRILEEIVNLILNLSGWLVMLSLPPFNKNKEVTDIIDKINQLKLNITTDLAGILTFTDSLMNELKNISFLLKKLYLIIIEEFQDLKEIEIQNTLFVALFFTESDYVNDINDGNNKLILRISSIFIIFISQNFIRIQMVISELIKRLKEKITDHNLFIKSFKEFENDCDYNGFIHKFYPKINDDGNEYEKSRIMKMKPYDLIKELKLKKLSEQDLNLLYSTLCNCESFINIYSNYVDELNSCLFKLIEKKIIKYCSKIQQLIKRCGFNNKTVFEKKFKIFLLKFKMLDKSESTKIEFKNAFIELLETIKGELPKTNCVNFYGMDDVSKYDFYDLLKKIAIVLIELDKSSKKDIEGKINEIKPFLSTSDRTLSFFRKKKKKLKPTEESTESVEKPEVKINRLIEELNKLISYCILIQSKFAAEFNNFKKYLDTSNIKQIDITNFDNVWNSVAELKDSHKCFVGISKKEFSKKELYTKLKEIGKLLLSNISELEKEEKQQIEYNIVEQSIIQSHVAQQKQQEIAAAEIAVQ
jgi:hypothetical protein